MKRTLSTLLVLAALVASGCPATPAKTAAKSPAPAKTEAAKSPAPAKTEAAKTEAAKTEAAETGAPAAASTKTYTVKCGCAIKEVGHCGEYAEVDGKWLHIRGDLGLGDMPFCGKGALKAEITGAVQGDELAATKLTLTK
ncbi:MAG: hypothetical protein AB7N76_19355 [Planctomycetota bacterium]